MYPTVYWGDLLRGLREKHYMLQKEVAILLHTSRQSYCNLENGRSQPSVEQIAALSYIYDVNLLEYVQKCLPPGFVAEQKAYRVLQTRRVQEVRVEEEKKKKTKTLAIPQRGVVRHYEVNHTEEEPASKISESSSKEAPSPLNDPVSPGSPFPADPVTAEPMSLQTETVTEEPVSLQIGTESGKEVITASPKKRKRGPAVRYHNTSGMTSVDLLYSGKRPKITAIDENAFYGKLLQPEEPPKKKGRPTKKKAEDKPSEREAAEEKADSPASPSVPKTIPGKRIAESIVAEEIKPPMPEELLNEMFPRESPYPRKSR
ncbi:MAG: helix-turn-helix transcriptional regulator [Eubacterium sp.]|nr:helix-turn-helix transcriptional regulator [Eubacterium sp.]